MREERPEHTRFAEKLQSHDKALDNIPSGQPRIPTSMDYGARECCQSSKGGRDNHATANGGRRGNPFLYKDCSGRG